MDLSRSFRLLATSYEQIAVTKMEGIRQSVLAAREFSEGLMEVFTDVRISYENQLLKIITGNKKNNLEKENIKGKGRLVMLLTGSDRLHGDITERVFKYFVEYLENNNDQIAIVGSVGKEMYEGISGKREFQYFEAAGDLREGGFESFVQFAREFDSVVVFHGRFLNMVTQEPISTGVSGDSLPEHSGESRPKIEFVFEPTLGEDLKYFQTQVFLSLFRQTIHEGQLAQHASMVQSMEKAISGIDKRQILLKNRFSQVKNNYDNKKRLETLSGISLWVK